MEFCFGLLLLLFALLLVTCVGHFIWVAVAAFFKALSNQPFAEDRPTVREQAATQCGLCGQRLSTGWRACPDCGSDQQCGEARQLRELETALRQVATLVETEELRAEVGDTVRNSLERRRRELRQRLIALSRREPKARPAPRRVPTLASVEVVEAVTAAPQVPAPPAELPADSIPYATLAELPPVEAPRAPPINVERRPPRRSVAEMMAAFMEERNILWGELVGGLLIVGCSIALVISLRETLEEIPYFPFLIVGALTAAMIGAGRYTLSHWKLEATSRGLLVIGAMLVPLSFMVLAGLASGRERGALEVGIEVAAVAFFGWLVRGAANILVRQPVGAAAPRPDWLTTLAVLGASASLLLVPHIEALSDPRSGLLGLAGYLPAAVFVLTQALAWFAVYRQERISARQAGGLFLGLGLAVYALGVAFVFLLYRTENVGQALEYLAVPVALAGLPLLVGGTIALARLRGWEDTAAGESEQGGLPRGVAGVIATMLSLAGTLVLLLALVAAWPHPVRLTVIGFINFVVLAFVAHWFRLAPAYVPAQVCLAVAVLTGYHALAGNLYEGREELGRQLLASWLSPASGVVLLVLGALLAAVAEWQTWKGRATDGRYLVCGAGLATLASLLLVAADGMDAPGRAAGVFAAAAAGAWLVNARRQRVWLTALAAVILSGATFFAVFWFDANTPLAQTLVWALLADAALVLALAVAVGRATRGAEEPAAVGVRRAFVPPLEWAALVASTAAAISLAPALRWDWFVGATVAAFGIGWVWLVLSWRQRRPALFAAFQGTLAVSVVFGCLRALQTQAWFANDFTHLFAEVRSWQAYGVGLSALALAWVIARFGLWKNERAWALLEPRWPAGDHLLLGGLVVLAVLVTVIGVAGGVAEELTPLPLNVAAPTAPTSALQIHGPLGWCWLALLTAALGLSLWQGRALGAVLGLLAAGLCAAMTAAAAWDADIAVASAVRWALALEFVAGSALLWGRDRLGVIATAAGMRWERGATVSALGRDLLVVGAVVPVLLLTAAAAAVGFAHMQPSGPLAGSLFARIGPVANHLPMVLLAFGLAGHGIRERSSRYAFAAGQVLLAAVVGGHALAVITGGGAIGGREAVQLGQLATGATAVWLLAWLAVRRLGQNGQSATGVTTQPTRPGVLLVLQDGLTWGSHVLWLAPALLVLAGVGAGPTPDLGAVVVMQEAGSWLGWLVVGLAVAAGTAYRLDLVRAVPSWVVALASVLIGGVFCCTVAIYAPEWDQRALMFAAAALALGFVLTLVRWSVPLTPAWLRTSANSVTELLPACGVGGIAVLLAVRRAAAFDDYYWSALAVGVVGAAAVAAALLRRGEGWMFAASLLAMLATSFVVCGAYPPEGSATWIVLVIQVNIATAGGVGLFWLSCRRRIYPAGRVALQVPWWLCAQQALAFIGNSWLLLLGLAALVLLHGPVIPLALAMGRVAGWLALALAVVGATWLLRVVAPRWTLHALAAGGLLAGVQAGCTATQGDLLGVFWLGQHVLTLTWLLTAVGVLGAAWAAEAHRHAAGEERRPWWAELTSRGAGISWVLGIGAAVALLAFAGGWADPFRPYWPSAVVLGVSILFGALAVWTRRGEIVYASGLLSNMAGHLAWLAWAETVPTPATDVAFHRLIFVHITCLAAASLAWSVIELVGPRVLRPPAPLKHFPPFRHFAAWAALGLLTLIVGSDKMADATGTPAAVYDPTLWFAVAALLAAAVATLWDSVDQRWAGPLPQLYALGLLTVGSALHYAGLTPQWLGWTVAVALGPYALLTSAVCRFGLRDPNLGGPLRLPPRPGGWPLAWFVPAQAALCGAAAALAVWVCLTFAQLGPRLASFGVVLFLVPAWALLVPIWGRLTAGWGLLPGRGPQALADVRLPRLAALLFGVLAAACLHCAFIAPDAVAPLLHRSVVLLAAVTWMSALYGLLLPRLLPVGSGWVWLSRRVATPLGILAIGILLLVLIQEFALYDVELRHTPLVLPGVLVVAAALAVLVAGSLTFALSPARDPLRLSERRRTLYVYAAEVLLVVLLVHLRLNVPDFFPAFVGKYWVFTVMAVAFLGAALSELFKRRGLRVLSDPLQRTAMFLPLLPLLAFLVRPFNNLRSGADGALSGLQPLTRYLDRLPDDYRWHASIWFLMALLYLVVALTRRSSHLALAAAVLANFGLWVLFGNHDQLTFRVHPQLWLIPLGLIVLAAEQINRERLQPAQALALRYAGLLLVYLSSTADLFITGLGRGVELPIVLALLSVAGVLLGILLRVRAFLFLGMTFLFLDVFSQIWYAAVDRSQTWVWWACGIILGAAILTLFALFEKRRNDLLKMLDEIKRWQ